jgi:hypothetical protein
MTNATNDMSNDESPVADSHHVPDWINESITWDDVAAIQQGGCASGAYMPAVTYYQAAKVMSDHGDDVLEYIVTTIGELPPVPSDTSWSAIAVLFLSAAVELWANEVAEAYAEDIAAYS